MRLHRRYQHGATAGAILLAMSAAAACLHRLYPPAVLFGLGVLVLTEAALRERRRHARAKEERTWLHRVAAPYCPHPGPLTPCCLLFQHSKGQAHSSRCTRPGQPGPPCDEAFMGTQREHLDQLLADVPGCELDTTPERLARGRGLSALPHGGRRTNRLENR